MACPDLRHSLRILEPMITVLKPQPEPEPAKRIPGPQPGTGTRLTSNALGYAISASPGGRGFTHPFTPQLGVGWISFSIGLVEGREPTIGKVPISGAAGVIPPRLMLKPGVANADGQSWACLEVEPDADGILTPESRRELVHTNQPVSHALNLGRCPIALILWRDRRPVAAIAIVYFNLRYARHTPAPGSGAVQHFFL